MTQQQPLNVIESFQYEGRWYHKGDRFPIEGVTPPADLVERYTGVYLLDDKELARRTNPQAYSIQTQLEQAQARIRELEAQGGDGPDLTPLLELFKDEDGTLPTFDEALDSVKVAVASAEQGVQAERLKAFYAPVDGTKLPNNFNARAILSDFGIETYEPLRGKTAEQLQAAMPDLSDEQTVAIVEKVAKHFAQD